MERAPYSAGDRLRVLLDDGPRDAVVSVVLESQASDPGRRWRLLCREADTDRSIDVPLYCGDDGAGDRVSRIHTATRCPAGKDEAAVSSDVAYVTACALGLAFSEHDGIEAIQALVRAAAGRRETLEGAREALPGYPGKDPAVVQAASALLIAAAISLADYGETSTARPSMTS